MKNIHLRSQVFISLFALVFAVACSSSRPEGKTEAEILYKEAQALVEDGKYLMATEKLNTLKAQHPYSYFAKYAELLLADVLFAQENYAEASAAYILFRDFHPKFERIEYVIWKIAESFQKQLPSTHDRDLSTGLEAIKYYREIADKYPSGEYAPQARNKVIECENMLRDKEKYIADFYFKTEVYDSARYRYLDIIKNQKDPELLSHSMARVVEASYLLKEYKACKNYYASYKGKVQGDSAETLEHYGTLCAEM